MDMSEAHSINFRGMIWSKKFYAFANDLVGLMRQTAIYSHQQSVPSGKLGRDVNLPVWCITTTVLILSIPSKTIKLRKASIARPPATRINDAWRSVLPVQEGLISMIQCGDLPPGAMFKNCSGLTLGSEQATVGCIISKGVGSEEGFSY